MDFPINGSVALLVMLNICHWWTKIGIIFDMIRQWGTSWHKNGSNMWHAPHAGSGMIVVG
jgi:hypothetical protein